ncbi:hypothetical protein GCM10027567_13030 [Spongiibacter taiwanensis]
MKVVRPGPAKAGQGLRPLGAGGAEIFPQLEPFIARRETAELIQSKDIDAASSQASLLQRRAPLPVQFSFRQVLFLDPVAMGSATIPLAGAE